MPFCVCVCVYTESHFYDIQNEIQSWEDGPRILGLLLKAAVLSFPVVAQGEVLWDDECMNAM